MLDFPNSAEAGDSYTSPGGQVYIYDGAKWIGSIVQNGTSLPSQTGQGGKFLTTDGNGTLSWNSVAASGIPAQTNNSGKYLTTNGSSLSWGTVSTSLPSDIVTNTVTANNGFFGAHTAQVGYQFSRYIGFPNPVGGTLSNARRYAWSWMDTSPSWPLNQLVAAGDLTGWTIHSNWSGGNTVTITGSTYTPGSNKVLEITTSATLLYDNSAQNVTITSPNYSPATASDLTLTAGSNTWSLGTDSYFRLPGGTSSIISEQDTVVIEANGAPGSSNINLSNLGAWITSAQDVHILSAGGAGGQWVFGADESLTFPDNLKVNNSVISRRLEAPDGNGISAVGSKLTLTDNNITMEGYIDPDGLNNNQYGRVVASSNGVQLSFTAENLGGNVETILNVGSGITIGATDGILNSIWRFDLDGTLRLPANGDIIDNAGTSVLNGLATESYVNTQIANLVNSAPATLDTLKELADALGSNSSFATANATALGNRLRVDINNQNLDSTQKSNAITNLGLQTDRIKSGNYSLIVQPQGHITIPTSQYSTAQMFSNAGVDLLIGTLDSGNYWQFKTNGRLTLPTGNSSINKLVDDAAIDILKENYFNRKVGLRDRFILLAGTAPGDHGYPWGQTIDTIDYTTYDEIVAAGFGNPSDMSLDMVDFISYAATTTNAYSDWQNAESIANIKLTTGSRTWKFDRNGSLTLPNNSAITQSSGYVVTAGTYKTLSADVDTSATQLYNVTTIKIPSSYVNDGTLALNSTIKDSANQVFNVQGFSGNSSVTTVGLGGAHDVTFPITVRSPNYAESLVNKNSLVVDSSEWEFRGDGSIKFPNGDIQSKAFTGTKLFNHGNEFSLEYDIWNTDGYLKFPGKTADRLKFIPSIFAGGEFKYQGTNDSASVGLRTYNTNTNKSSLVQVSADGWVYISGAGGTITVTGSGISVGGDTYFNDNVTVYGDVLGAGLYQPLSIKNTGTTRLLGEDNYGNKTIISAVSDYSNGGNYGAHITVDTSHNQGGAVQQWDFKNDGSLRLPNTVELTPNTIEEAYAETLYNNALAAWETLRAQEESIANIVGVTATGWPYIEWHPTGITAQGYLDIVNNAWTIQNAPASPPQTLIFSPAISASLRNQLITALTNIINRYAAWQALLSGLEINAGTDTLAITGDGRLYVPDIIFNTADEALVLRTRYTAPSSPPSSTPYVNLDYTFDTNGFLTFPNGSSTSGESIISRQNTTARGSLIYVGTNGSWGTEVTGYSFTVFQNVDTDLVHQGSIIIFKDGTQRTVTSITTGQSYQGPIYTFNFDQFYASSAAFPLHIRSSDYREASADPVVLTSNNKSWVFDGAGELSLPNTSVIRPANDEIDLAKLAYDNAVGNFRYNQLTSWAFQVIDPNTFNWPFLTWNVTGPNAQSYLDALDYAWTIQTAPSSPQVPLIFSPAIAQAFYNEIRSAIIAIQTTYNTWQTLVPSVDIVAGNEKLSVYGDGRLYVPDIVTNTPDEDLILRVRYTNPASPPVDGSIRPYLTSDYTFSSNGYLKVPNGITTNVDEDFNITTSYTALVSHGNYGTYSTNYTFGTDGTLTFTGPNNVSSHIQGDVSGNLILTANNYIHLNPASWATVKLSRETSNGGVELGNNTSPVLVYGQLYLQNLPNNNTTGNVLFFNSSTNEISYGALTSSYTLPQATTSILGGVKVDGTSITINGSGVISANTSGFLTSASPAITTPAITTGYTMKAGANDVVNEYVVYTLLATNAASQVLDTLATASYTSVHYIIEAKNGTGTEMVEVNLTYNGTTAYINASTLISVVAPFQATYDADVSGGNLRLLVTPLTSNTKFKIRATAFKVI